MDYPIGPFDVYMNWGIDQESYHWCSCTQPIAPAHILLQYLADLWTLNPLVISRRYALSEHRSIEVYTFILYKGDKKIVIPVLTNPIVLRVIHEYDMHVQHHAAPTRENCH